MKDLCVHGNEVTHKTQVSEMSCNLILILFKLNPINIMEQSKLVFILPTLLGGHQIRSVNSKFVSNL